MKVKLKNARTLTNHKQNFLELVANWNGFAAYFNKWKPVNKTEQK